MYRTITYDFFSPPLKTAYVIFKEKTLTIFAIILRQLEKWGNYKKDT
jgi:hypothetical protein